MAPANTTSAPFARASPISLIFVLLKLSKLYVVGKRLSATVGILLRGIIRVTIPDVHYVGMYAKSAIKGLTNTVILYVTICSLED